jgi:chaperonin cofactor prefoldin
MLSIWEKIGEGKVSIHTLVASIEAESGILYDLESGEIRNLKRKEEEMGNVSMIDGHIDEPRMTDDEIIKALKCCIESLISSCRNCPYVEENRCKTAMMKDALDLINRQQAEVEKLTVNMNAFGLGMKIEAEKAEKAQAEIEKLKAESQMADGYVDALVERTKSEAIKEFDEQYKKIKTNRLICSYCYFKDGVDNLLKEMVGDAE